VEGVYGASMEVSRRLYKGIMEKLWTRWLLAVTGGHGQASNGYGGYGGGGGHTMIPEAEVGWILILVI